MPIEVVLQRSPKNKETGSLGEVLREVTLNEMNNLDDFDQVKSNLYCAFDGCSARIEYVPKGARIAHFKTWPRENHTTECLDFFEREEVNKKKLGVAASSRAISDKHINNVLRALINSVAETEEEREIRLASQRSKRSQTVNPIVNSDSSGTQSNRVHAVVGDHQENSGESKRAPIVRKRHNISFLTEDDLATATALYEIIDSVSLNETRVVFTLKRGRKESNVYFEEAFFAESPPGTLSNLKVIKERVEKGDKIGLYCVGNVEMRNEKLSLVIESRDHIRINKETLTRYIFLLNNPDMM